MFKKLLNRRSPANEFSTVFIPHESANITIDNQSSYGSKYKKIETIHKVNQDGLERNLVDILLGNKEFMLDLTTSVTTKILEILVEKYEFTPTDKYLQEKENRQQYIGQLDAYLKERKEINEEVENDLQKFLHETTLSLTKALDSFGVSVQQRIKEAELRYGIDGIRTSVLQK